MNVRVRLCGFTISMKRYARHFPVVEVQNTFYDPPLNATLSKWRTITPPRFEYTMKVWQLVTHAAPRVAAASRFTQLVSSST